MSISLETKLDYDRSVSTEDRFAIRKCIESFVKSVNKADLSRYEAVISDGIIVEGFSDIPQLKQGFITMLSRRFLGDNARMMRFPELKLSFHHYLFHLHGTYEEFNDGLLVTEGTIEMDLVKNIQLENYQFVRANFYPRMMLQETDDL